MCGAFPLNTLKSFFVTTLLVLGKSHTEILYNYLVAGARELAPDSSATGLRRSDAFSAPYLPFDKSAARCTDFSNFKIKPLGAVGNCLVPLTLQYAATSLRPHNHVASVRALQRGSFSEMHPQMLSDLLAANVVTLGDPHPQLDSGCYKGLIPVYHTVKHSEGKPELLTIWNAKYLNDTHPVTNVAFSYSHFGKLFSLLSSYHTQGKTPFFSKHDWRKFYNSLILGRLLKAGVVLEGRLQELLTTRAVFGRNTEPAIGQLVNESLWRERVRGPLHSTDVECMLSAC